jgi:hypothetical protein
MSLNERKISYQIKLVHFRNIFPKLNSIKINFQNFLLLFEIRKEFII